MGGSSHLQANRGNGLLNALSATSRSNDERSASGTGTTGTSTLPTLWRDDGALTTNGAWSDGMRTRDGKRGDETRQKPVQFREEGSGKTRSAGDGTSALPEKRNRLGNSGADAATGRAREESNGNSTPDVVDPLAGMAAVDKWGIKGLRTLMNNYPDFQAMVVGMDPTTLGFDLGAQE